MRLQENLSNFSWSWPISGMCFASWMNYISSVKAKTCTYTCTWQTRLLHSLESWRHAPCALINKTDFREPEWRCWNHCFWSHLRDPIYSSFLWEKSISMILPKPVYLGYGSIHCSRLVFILFIIIIYWTGQTFHLNVIFMNCKIFLFNIFICTYLYLEHPLGLALLKMATLLKWHQTPSWGWGLQPWLSKF